MPANIVTRATKGAALTHQEMDANLDNLKATADAGEAKALALETENPDWKKHLPTRAEFEALAADRRAGFAGSGFIHWGRSRLGGYTPINQGMHVDVSSGDNLALHNVLGSATSAAGQWSESIYPVANVDGYALHIYYVRLADRSQLIFPPAPAVAALADRLDLAFLEVWHEDVAEKDFVYPLGNIQFGGATFTPKGGSALACAAGAFAGYDTYSLFGNWQSAGDLVGKGAVWSTMTDAQKRDFVADPVNNCYLAGGTVVQVRYRVRIVEGLGSSWLTPAPMSAAWYLAYDGNNIIKAKGKKTSIAADLGAYSADVFHTITGALNFADLAQNPPLIGAGKIRPTGSSVAHDSLCFALPLALVHRRNQGAYHPVWNPNGSAKLNTTGAYASGGVWYDSTAIAPTSVADCFVPLSDCATNFTDVGYSTLSGYIGMTSGRPDGRFYDEIHERDVLDLRFSAHKVLDLRRTLEREFNNLASGSFRGWEKQPQADIYTQPTTAATTSSVHCNDPTVYELGDNVSCYDFTGAAWVFQGRTIIGKGADYITVSGATFARTQGNDYLVAVRGKGPALPFASRTLVVCDIIGDPANYPSAWQSPASPFAGLPLVVGENGEDLIPDGTAKTYKMSRKVKNSVLCLKSTDGGATWTVFTSWDSAIEGDANAYTTATPTAGDLYLIFYDTDGDSLVRAFNSEIVAASIRPAALWGAAENVGSHLCRHLVGKVPTVSTTRVESRTLNQVFILPESSKYNNALSPTHDAFTLYMSGPAVKVLPYLARSNGKLVLQMILKEMIHNGSSWGDDSQFNIVDNESTATDNNGKTVKTGQKRVDLQFYFGDGE